MFGIIDSESRLFFKVDENNLGDFEAHESEPFKTRGSRKFTMHYYEVPMDVVEDHEELTKWAYKAIEVSKRAAKTTNNNESMV